VSGKERLNGEQAPSPVRYYNDRTIAKVAQESVDFGHLKHSARRPFPWSYLLYASNTVLFDYVRKAGQFRTMDFNHEEVSRECDTTLRATLTATISPF